MFAYYVQSVHKSTQKKNMHKDNACLYVTWGIMCFSKTVTNFDSILVNDET